jgi:DNA-binding response OmpR family regulator
MTRIVVDLPAPFGPTKPVTRPGRTVNVMPSSAVVAPNRLRSAATSMVGVFIPPFYAPAGDSTVSVADTWLSPLAWHCGAMRILVAEDFEVLAEAVAAGLRREGMAVDVALDGDDAVEHLTVNRYDVIVLDRDLPGVHGDEVCRRAVAAGTGSRVLMLTAASTVRDRVEGLGLGADDYLPKPFDFAELVARVRALGRRSAPATPPVLSSSDVVLDPAQRVAHRAGRRLELSPKEFAVLECLLAAGGRVVSAEELLERVWDEMADPFTTTVKTTIRRLRGKLGEPPVIRTVSGGGYQIGAAGC